ncbi:MAG: hypothetical protein SF123_03535 [Chloroflexota bacterium]|nr:hypothetical protein [Chloroflexota bacterium]
MQPATVKPSALVKPTLDTKYHIDYSWWERNPEEDLRTYILSHLSPEQRAQMSEEAGDTTLDYIDMETGEVLQVDAVGMAIQVAAKEPSFINQQVSLVDSVFRVFLSNGNQPLSVRELEERTGRSAATILKTLSGGRVWKGIRPYQS